jgi:hypothetical protein
MSIIKRFITNLVELTRIDRVQMTVWDKSIYQ